MTAVAASRLLELAHQQGWELVVLFGSQARGTARAGSDTDIGVLRGSGPRDARGLERFDLVWLDEASWLLCSEVAREGRCLWQASPGAFENFQSESLRRSWLAEVWRQRDRDFLKRTVEGELHLKRDLVLRKTAQLAQYLQEIEPLIALDAQRFLNETVQHYAAERLLELIVECAGTINTEVSQAVASIPPSDYYSSFFSMVSAGWLTQELAEELSIWTGWRNRLVHRYENVSLPEFQRLLQGFSKPWRAYLAAIQAKL